MKVAEGIYLLGGAELDSNIYCVDNELLVDCGSGLFNEQILQQMENYRIDPGKIKMIVVTHAHFDHCGAIKEWKNITGGKVFIHKKDMAALETGEGTMADVYDVDYEGVSPDGLLREGEEIKTKNHTFKIIHTPGHTEGGVSLWDEENKILISGDTLFLRGFGRTDCPRGNKKALKESLEKLKKLEDEIEILLPGHGTPASKRNPHAKETIKETLCDI